MTGVSRLFGRSRAALLALALALPASAAPSADYIRESRWAQEVLAGLVVGDPVYLATPARPRILALYTEPSGRSKGGVILVHGLGVHPDFGMIGGVRTGLADAGFTTLSVQMPVLAADAPRDDYRATLPEATDRVAAAIAWLSARGVAKIAIVSHSYGATMVDAYLARYDAARIDAWVPAGMLIDFTAAPKQPVLDVVAEKEFKEVLAAAPLRQARLPKDGCSRGATIAGADHYFDRRLHELTAQIVAFLERVFAGRC
jgi:alpha/beta superfamily hydrolase